ncbi:type VI secretion system baseplate subunit TssG [Pedobacter agri]|uniref:type VI secretion system baseplate subunit TssG n=1 Tax=Pedobacter agri TaxID=454586 RepID=UPI00292FCEC7|nr:type VI secretion system baseplate subunit TssG [Pedobacter agri]
MKKKSLASNELFTDYKAVTFAAELVEGGMVDMEKIEILPVGGDTRAFSKDLKNSYDYYSHHRSTTRHRLEVNREGLYDMLPEGLFHHIPKGNNALDEEEMIKDIVERREEEKNARLFFSPFDIEIYHTRMIAEVYENRLDKWNTYDDMNQIFQLGWAEFRSLNNEQSIVWMHLLPEISQRRNDLNFLAQLLGALFNTAFVITDITDQKRMVPIANEQLMVLGQGSLGIDSIAGNEFPSDNDQISIKIGPCSPDLIVSLMPERHQRKILDMVLDYLIPFDTDVDLTFANNSQGQSSALDIDSAEVYLGYTVYL